MTDTKRRLLEGFPELADVSQSASVTLSNDASVQRLSSLLKEQTIQAIAMAAMGIEPVELLADALELILANRELPEQEQEDMDEVARSILRDHLFDQAAEEEQ